MAEHIFYLASKLRSEVINISVKFWKHYYYVVKILLC